MFEKSPILAIALAAMPLCHGAIVFSHGVFDSPVNAVFSDPGQNNWLAGEFTLSSSTEINSLIIEGIYGLGYAGTDQFSIAIMESAGGAVGPVVGSYSYSDLPSTREEGIIFTGYQFYKYTLALPSTVTLGPGSYWFAVANGSSTGDWAWSTSTGDIANYAHSVTSLTSGYASGNSTSPFVFAFDDTVVVPEPSAIALGGLGLGLLVRRKRR